MKNRKILIVVAIIVTLAIGVGIGAYAASNFGTQSDPLVAKSYIDNVLTPSLQSQYQAQLDSQVQKLEQKISNVTASGSGNFAVVSLSSGGTLTGGSGCEIILTSGAASASSGSFSDITSGNAVASGGALTANHLCVVNSDSGTVKASAAVTLLVRGAYTTG